MRAAACFAVAVLLALACAGSSNAAKKSHDQYWTSPDFASLGVDYIAVMPAATFDNNIQNEGLVEAAVGQALANGRLDSASATGLAKLLRCNGVLTVRVDQFERHEPEFNQAGTPTTIVQLTGALVDSLGHLAWSGSGAQYTKNWANCCGAKRNWLAAPTC